MHGGNKPQEWDWKWLIVVQGQENSAGARAWERETFIYHMDYGGDEEGNSWEYSDVYISLVMRSCLTLSSP